VQTLGNFGVTNMIETLLLGKVALTRLLYETDSQESALCLCLCLCSYLYKVLI
jgi:hypothetical protein